MSTTTTLSKSELVELMRADPLPVGMRAARLLDWKTVAFLEEGAAGLVTPDQREVPEGVRVLHCLPEGPADLQALRRAFPRAWIHAAPPAGEPLASLDADSLCWWTGPVESPTLDVERMAGSRLPVVASFQYGPESTAEQIVERLWQLRECPSLATVVPLPAGVGDLILIRGATTDGDLDVAVLAACRLALPRVHVRSSWAALGWKLAQVGLMFGADEVAGWGAEEQLAYTSRLRPASRVERAEVEAGIREAKRLPLEMTRCDWAC